ncbi:MAG: hypothetical protein K6B44_10525 [Lachnospiraceae bacterium]|nr:hypothetical protein [Lachnospiraceae bacterium]
MTDEEKQVNELIDMIDGKMSNGVSRLSIGFSEDLFSGVKRETYHHGRCDVGSPWAKGTVSNCDVIDADEEDYRNKRVTLKISKGIG